MNVKLFRLSLEGPSTKEQKYCDNNREMTKTWRTCFNMFSNELCNCSMMKFLWQVFPREGGG